MRFYTTEELGPSQSLTPEGFLVVRNAPLARTGHQLYSEKALPLTGDSDGHIIIQRDTDEVFRDQTINSFHGKPITLDHPDEDVNPDNWKRYAVGYVMNPHRGDGVLNHLLLGDLVVTDARAIKAIRDRQFRELSAGYDAEYEQTTDGRGRQRNIVANHVALVKDGRCGVLCRIADSAVNIRTRDSAAMIKRAPRIHLHIHLLGASKWHNNPSWTESCGGRVPRQLTPIWTCSRTRWKARFHRI
jgi:hypothetical protein